MKIIRNLHMNKRLLFAFVLWLAGQMAAGQGAAAQQTAPPTAPAGGQTAAPQQPVSIPTTIPQIKAALESSPNPPLYAKQILKRRFKIDAVVVSRTRAFNSLADSLAYNGKERKVYGPFGPHG